MTDLRITRLEAVFRDTFLARWNTLLVGGADEPLYLPASGDCPRHRLIYRADYFASALHETAHWCIAGPARRLRVDFGYWYAPDGRSAAQQRAFEAVEVRPQALEWTFSEAAGHPFYVSADNLAGDAGPSPHFVEAVRDQARAYCQRGLPERAHLFAEALAREFGTGNPFDKRRYLRPPA